MADHVQDLCIFLDPLTGEEYRPVSTHLLGTTRQGTESAKKEVCLTSGTTATVVVNHRREHEISVPLAHRMVILSQHLPALGAALTAFAHADCINVLSQERAAVRCERPQTLGAELTVLTQGPGSSAG